MTLMGTAQHSMRFARVGSSPKTSHRFLRRDSAGVLRRLPTPARCRGARGSNRMSSKGTISSVGHQRAHTRMPWFSMTSPRRMPLLWAFQNHRPFKREPFTRFIAPPACTSVLTSSRSSRSIAKCRAILRMLPRGHLSSEVVITRDGDVKYAIQKSVGRERDGQSESATRAPARVPGRTWDNDGRSLRRGASGVRAPQTLDFRQIHRGF